MAAEENVRDVNLKETAKIVRQVLKQEFPCTKFSVRTKRASKLDAIDIHYTDGPARKAVEAAIERFRKAIFDGVEGSDR